MTITIKRFKLLYRVYMAAQKLQKTRPQSQALADAVQELRTYESTSLVATWAEGIPRTQRPSK